MENHEFKTGTVLLKWNLKSEKKFKGEKGRLKRSKNTDGMKGETDQPKDYQVSSKLEDLSAVIFVTFNNIMEYEIENQPWWTTFRSILVEEG